MDIEWIKLLDSLYQGDKSNIDAAMATPIDRFFLELMAFEDRQKAREKARGNNPTGKNTQWGKNAF